MVASGNDFILLDDSNYAAAGRRPDTGRLAIEMCQRISGVGADGLLLLKKGRGSDVNMRIFNADGSEAEMCGNGARCVALYWAGKTGKKNIVISTIAGRINAHLGGKKLVRIKLPNVQHIRFDLPLRLGLRSIKVNYIDTGVPHTVVLVSGLDKIDVVGIGSRIRWHRKFLPRGTNVDFVEVVSPRKIKVRTYERGVEDETLSCGTGVVASAIIVASKLYAARGNRKVDILTNSGDTLRVYFKKTEAEVSDVWLQGSAKVVYGGQYYV